MSYINEMIKKVYLIPGLIVRAPYSFPIVLLQCASGFFSAVGIPLLIPVLDYLKDGKAVGQSKILSGMEQLLTAVGIPVTFGSILIVSGVLFLLGQMLLTVSTLIAVYAQAELSRNYRMELMKAYGHVDWLWLLEMRTGEVNYFALRESDMASVAHLNAQRVVIYSVQVLVLMGIALKLSPLVTLLAAGVYSVIAVGNLVISKQIVRLATEYHRTFSKLSTDLVVLQQNKKFFKTSLLNEKMTGAIYSVIKRISVLTKKETFYMEFQRLFGMTVTFSFLLVVMFFHQTLGLEYSSLLVILFVFSRIAPNFSQLSTAFATLDSNIPAYEAVQARLKQLETHQEKSGKIKFESHQMIRFDRVSFVYPNGKRIFENVDLGIEPRKTTVFVGSSGSGKSTLLDLLLGLLKPTSGEILYGKVGHNELDKDTFRTKVAYVSQETTLVDGTLEENLSIRVNGIQHQELIKVVEKVGLDHVIAGLPGGLKAQIGENGVKLSGGQRQRVALARALLMDPEILILDEATSNLDTESEKSIMETIKSLKKEFTIIIVAHRLASIDFADKIYTLDNMKIIPSSGLEVVV